MPLTKTITPQSYYSYKDWGQKVYDVANTALSMAQGIKGASGGAKGASGGTGISTGANGGSKPGTFALNNFQGGISAYNKMYGTNQWGGGLGQNNMYKLDPQQLASSSATSSWPSFLQQCSPLLKQADQFDKQYPWLRSSVSPVKANSAPPNFNPNFDTSLLNPPKKLSGGGEQQNIAGMVFSGLGDIADTIGGNAGTSQQTAMAGVQQAPAAQQPPKEDENKGAVIGKAFGDIGSSWTGGGDTWSNIGKTIEIGNTATVKAIGNQYKDPGQRIAYGNSTYVAPSRRDLDRKTNQYIHDLRDQAFYSDATTMGGLAQDASQEGIYQQVSKDINSGQKWLGIGQRSLNASGKGAALGSKIGGFAGPTGSMIGTIAGGVIGGIAGIFGGAFGAKRGRERLRRIQAAQRYNNLSKDYQIQTAASNIGQRQVNNFWAHSIAKGGRIEHLINGDRLKGVARVYDVRPSDVRPLFDIH